MDSGFFGSKYFIVSAIVAAILLGGAAGAYYMSERSPGGARFFSDGCDTPTLGGNSVAAPEPSVTVESEGRRRIEVYTLDAARYEGGALKACIDVGDIVIEPSSGSAVEIVFEIAGKSSAAVSATEVDAAFATKAGGLVVGAWESRRGEEGGLFGGDSAGVLLTVRLPATGAYDLDVYADVGDIQVTDLLVGEADVVADVGNVAVREVDLTGNVSVHADVGNVLLAARSVQSSKLEATTDVGDATVELPRRTEIGYDAVAAADVGEAFIDIGATEASTSEDDGPSQHREARSQGYSEKVTKVVVRAIADVGDTRITSA